MTLTLTLGAATQPEQKVLEKQACQSKTWLIDRNHPLAMKNVDYFCKQTRPLHSSHTRYPGLIYDVVVHTAAPDLFIRFPFILYLSVAINRTLIAC